jgi:hypothetical protein
MAIHKENCDKLFHNGFKPRVSWKTIRLSGLLTTEEIMLYALDENNANKSRSSEKRNVASRFKRHFRNHSMSLYLQYKDFVLFESQFQLKEERRFTREALLILDFHYIASTKKIDAIEYNRAK